ncbi:MAG: hypothetical protein VKI42_09195, partial [Synechococcaceae cyanobacterium]|nr:hypothetical protein [Synechococcaceae cyanobacterium]
PYIFNRANLERFSSGRYCQACPKALSGCPFEASYEVLQERLFRPYDPRSQADLPPASTGSSAATGAPGATGANPSATLPGATGPAPTRPLLWVHGEALGPANPSLRAHPGAPALFVFDTELIEGRAPSSGGHPAAGGSPQPLAAGRLRFLRECLEELPLQVREGDVARELLAEAEAQGCDGIVTSRAVDPRFAQIASRLAAALPLRILNPEPFVDLPLVGRGAPDLRRFSRYWKKAESLAWDSVKLEEIA